MDEPDAPQRTKDEAAAAVIALGPQLEWKEDSQETGIVVGIGSNGAFYIVRYLASHFRHLSSCPWVIDWRGTNRDDWRQCVVKGTKRARKFTERTTAIASCERHYATGNWD